MNKHALCIGIDAYPGTGLDLAGCVNDAKDWAAELGSRGFVVRTLLDAQATKAGLVDALGATLAGAAHGDLVVVTYAGHGTYVGDREGDEADGLDEALCPHDITNAGPLRDDEIHALLAARHRGVRVVVIADTCHAGTALRAAPAAADAPRARFLPLAHWLPPERLPRDRSGTPLAKVKVKTGASPFSKSVSRIEGDVLLVACKQGADNFAYEAHIDGRVVGAFSHHALQALRGLPPNASYGHWLAAITPARLPSPQCPQTPQLVAAGEDRSRKLLT